MVRIAINIDCYIIFSNAKSLSSLNIAYQYILYDPMKIY